MFLQLDGMNALRQSIQQTHNHLFLVPYCKKVFEEQSPENLKHPFGVCRSIRTYNFPRRRVK